jgi:hypothetical protein
MLMRKWTSRSIGTSLVGRNGWEKTRLTPGSEYVLCEWMSYSKGLLFRGRDRSRAHPRDGN